MRCFDSLSLSNANQYDHYHVINTWNESEVMHFIRLLQSFDVVQVHSEILITKVQLYILVTKPQKIIGILLLYIYIYIVGSQIVAHTLTEAGNGPNRPNTIDL